MAGMNAAQLIPGALQVGGSLLQASGARQAGRAAVDNSEAIARAKEFEAQQLEQQGGTAVAVSQRRAQEEERQARLVASRALAVAAASGGGASDVSVVNLIATTRAEGQYRAAIALYEGEEQRRVLNMQAAGKRHEGSIAIAGGQAQRRAANITATSAILKGAGSLFAKYGFNSDEKTATGGPAGLSGPVDHLEPYFASGGMTASSD